MSDNDDTADPENPLPATKLRAPWIVGATILLAATLVGAYLVFFNDTADKPNDNPAAASRPSQCVPVNQGATVDSPEEPPEDGGIEIVEQNAMVSQRPHSQFGMSTFGAVLTNKSSLVAYGIEVAFTPLDQQGDRSQTSTIGSQSSP